MTMQQSQPQYPQRLPWLFGRSAARTLARIEHILAIIRRNQEKLMSDMDNLKQAVSDLKTEVAAIATEMDTLLADLKQAVAGNDTEGIKQATADIQAQVDVLKAAGSRDAPSSSSP